LTIAVIFMVTIVRKLLSKGKHSLVEAEEFDPNPVAGTDEIYPHLLIVRVGEDSPLIDTPLAVIQLTNKYGVIIISIKRKVNGNFSRLQQREQIVPKAKTTLQAGDRLLLLANLEDKQTFFQKYHLIDETAARKKPSRKYLLSDIFGISEMIVTPN